MRCEASKSSQNELIYSHWNLQASTSPLRSRLSLLSPVNIRPIDSDIRSHVPHRNKSTALAIALTDTIRFHSPTVTPALW